MIQNSHHSTTSYYRTLYSKYGVADDYLQTRGQRRATGAFLEQLETKDILANDSVPKRCMKRFKRAFQGTLLFRQIAATVTVAAMLSLLQSSPVTADSTAVDEKGFRTEVVESMPGELLSLDADSDLKQLNSSESIHKASLHFVKHMAPYSAVSFAEENTLSIDGDSDIPWQVDQGRVLTVIDTAIEGWQTLKEAVTEGEILLLKDEDPLVAIIEKLSGMGGVDTLSIISHGDQGALYLSGHRLSLEALEQQSDQWQRLGSYLSEEGDLNLYGCNIAKGDTGKAFVSKLADLTGADVAASINPTGNPEQNGDWVLEVVQGEIDQKLVMNARHLKAFEGVLWNGTIDFSQVNYAGVYNSTAGIDASVFNDAGHLYTLIGNGLLMSTRAAGGVLYSGYTSPVETQLTLSFSNGETFDTNTIDLRNCGPQTTFRVTSNFGETATTASLATDANDTVNLSGFSTSLTSLTITNNAGGAFVCLGVHSLGLTNLQPAVVNTLPVLEGTFTTAGTLNDTATISPFSGVTASDADADNLTVSITYTAANGTLSGTGLTGTPGSYTVTDASPAVVTTNLQALVFTPTANQVAAGTTVVSTFTLTPNDGTADGAANATTQITATSINDNPTITSNGGGATAAISINENSTAATTVVATDVDPSTTMTYSISGGVDAAAFSINSGTGVLTFTSAPNFEAPTDNGSNNVYDVQVTATDDGPGTLTDVQDIAVTVNNINENPLITSNGGGASASVNAAENQTAVTTVSAFDSDTGDTLSYSISGGADAALFGINPTSGVLTFNSAPNFEAPSDSGANGIYDVQVTVTDNGAGNLTDLQNIAVTVTSVNENPVITSNGGGATAATSINESTTAVTTVTATDVDAGDSLSYSISGGADAAAFSINASSGVLIFSSAPDFEAPTDNGANNVYDVQVTVTDDGAGSLTDVQDIAVTVNNVNDNPLITSNGGGATAAVNAAENQTAVTTVTATDTDAGDTLTYSISGGADAALFGINATSGVLSFNSAPDFENPTDSGANGVYDVQVTVTDDGTGNLTDMQSIAITVTSVNENPVITSNAGGATAAISIDENTTAVTTVTATDADVGDTLSYSISGGLDAAAFTINASSGVLTFNSAPNFDAPTDNGANNVYDVQVTVTDNGAGSLTDVQDLAVTVNNVNVNPVITSDGGGATAAVNAAENQTAVTTVTATDSDVGDVLTFSISGGADAALFSINGTSGVLTFNSAPDFEAPTDSGANGVYDLQVTVTDDGAGALTDVQSIAVTVTGANDNPVITSNGGGATATTSIDENTTAVTTVTATDSDVGDTLSYSISGGLDAAAFTINTSSGVLSFNSAPDFETPADNGANNVYDVQVTVTDDGAGSLTDVQDIAVTVNNANDSPVITSNGGGATAAVSVAEGQTSATTVTATDPDAGNTLTYSISGGADAALFGINGASGVLTFNTAPVFSAPTDSGANGIYDVQVTVTDDGVGNLTDVQDIAVTVTRVNSAPAGSLSISGSAEEGQILSVVNNITDGDGLGTMRYQWMRDGVAISGATATTFTLSSADIGHTLSVTASYTDGGGTTERVTSSATAAVANVNDEPSGSLIIIGEAIEGQVLSADTSTLADGDGLGIFSYHWLSGTTETTENSAIYTLTASDVGNRISVSVSYTDGQGTEERVTSEATAAVTGIASGVPIVVAPADITVDATGLFTEIDIGTASATDSEDGDLIPQITTIVSNGKALASVADTPVYFSPGIHQLTWTATDSDTNSGAAIQRINVVPMVSFNKNQVSVEGETARFKVILNGPAVDYPVTVPYTLSGTMLDDGSDHNLSDGSITIDAPELEASVNVSFVDDGVNEGVETLVVRMGEPENAIVGAISSHQIEVRESNVAPTVVLITDQNGVITRLIGQAEGPVSVMAVVTDPNTGDDHSYDWSGSDNRLIDTDSDPARFTFDPTNLDLGAYWIKLAVNDGSADGDAKVLLMVSEALPELTTEEDSDNDGLNDDVEGSGDSDSDGIPDYLDALDIAANVIQEQQQSSDGGYLMETEAGLAFRLGGTAFRANGHGASVTRSDITNYGHDGAGAEPDDEIYPYEGGLFDFTIEDLPVAGQSVSLVVPQFAPVPANAIYRKLMPSGWQNFVIDENNRLASSLGAAGYCPPPGDSAYVVGLTEGDWCVQLTIEDGGPNDADQSVNRSIDDPGGVTTAAASSGETKKSGGGGGVITLLSLIMLGLGLVRLQSRRRRQSL